eukprot:6212498-Pleurochrysis_carterae.AAC.2
MVSGKVAYPRKSHAFSKELTLPALFNGPRPCRCNRPVQTCSARAIRSFEWCLHVSPFQIVSVLMWEICKTSADAAKEFDRTMEYINGTLEAHRALLGDDNAFKQIGGVIAQVKRRPVGVMLNMGPFNYPFNET